MLRENKIVHIISLGIVFFTLMCLLPSFLPTLTGNLRETLVIGTLISFCTYFQTSRALLNFNKIYNISHFIDAENINKQSVSGVKISPVKARFWELNFDVIEKYKSEKRKILNVILLLGLIYLIIYLGSKVGMINIPLVCFIAFCSFRIATWGQVLAFLYINLFVFALGFSVKQSSHVLILICVIGSFFVLQKLLVTFHWWKIAKNQVKFVSNLKGSASIIIACCLLAVILSSVLNPKLNLVKNLLDYYEKLSTSSKIVENKRTSKEITVDISNLESIKTIQTQKLNSNEIEKTLKRLNQEINSHSDLSLQKDLNQKIKDLQKIEYKLKLKSGNKALNLKPLEKNELENLEKEFSTKAQKLSEEISLKRKNSELEQISLQIKELKGDKKVSDKKLNEIKTELLKIEKEATNKIGKKIIRKTEKLKNGIKKVEKRNKEIKEKRVWQKVLILLGLFSLLLYLKNLIFQKKVVHSGVELSDKIKNELKVKLRSVHKRYPSFKDEVLAKYRCFHFAMEEIHFEGVEAPPSMIIGRELSEKKVKEIAFELSHFFDKTQFIEKRHFSKKEIRHFRKSFSHFEKYLKKLLK